MAGQHYIEETLFIENVDKLTLMSAGDIDNPIISCSSANIGISFINVTSLIIDGLTISGCGMEITPSFFNETVNKYAVNPLNITTNITAGVFMNYINDLTLDRTKILNNERFGLLGVNVLGDVLIVDTNISLNNQHVLNMSECTENQLLTCKGGNMVLMYTDLEECPADPIQYSLVIENSVFQHGFDLGSTYQPYLRTDFDKEDLVLIGGGGVGIQMMQSSYGVVVNITGSMLTNNSAYVGANLYILMWDFVDNSSIYIKDTTINNGNQLAQFRNTVQETRNFDLASGMFFLYGMAFFTEYTPICTADRKYQVDILNIEDTVISYNEATLNSAVFMFMWPRSLIAYPRHITLSNVSMVGNNGDATIINFYVGDPNYSNFYKVFLFNCTFENNFYLKETRYIESANPQVYFASAHSFVVFEGCRWMNNRATSLTALLSHIHLNGTNTFINNTAPARGAGLNIRDGSSVIFEPNSITIFENNHAGQFGGAIFAEMFSYICFYVIDKSKPLPQIYFTNNSAGMAGDAVYANLENCLIHDYFYSERALPAFISISNFSDNDVTNSTSLISSEASTLCYCLNETYETTQCSNLNNTMEIRAYIGEIFKVTVIALSYTSIAGTNLGTGSTPTDVTATIINHESHVELGELQTIQSIDKGCSDINYRLLSSGIQTVELVLSPRIDRIYMPLVLKVTLESCPAGFEESNQTLQCECVPVLKRNNVICNSRQLTLVREPSAWIGIVNISNISHTGFSPICGAENYCNTSQLTHFKVDNPDVQCINNRAGVLCGKCQEGYSIAIGSSNCLECTNNYLILLIFFVVAGILLIGFLSLSKLTVSTGRINAFLFYANVIKLANYEFFGYEEKGFSIFQVIINWINLDFGIESCFYNGMDMYAKAWFQFLFSFYLYFLLAIPIIAARYSSKITKILPSNMLPVLMTTILITFTKLLRASTIIFPYATIETDENPVGVWLHDGNVLVFDSRYIPLFLFSLFMNFVVIFPFCTIMFLYSFIWSFSSHEGTKFEKFVLFIRKHLIKLKPFLDTYDAPYTANHRYWTGLLVLLRIVVFFLVFVVISSSANSILKTSGVTIISLILLGVILAGDIYHCKYNKRVEFLCLLNLAILELTLLILHLTLPDYARELGTGIVISISITFGVAVMIFGVIYEHYYIYKPKIYKWLGKEYTDTKCDDGINAEMEREINEKYFKTDKVVEDDLEFINIVDERRKVPRSSVSQDYDKLQKLVTPLNATNPTV
jgi:predicted outer membrane repeat protein